MSNAEEQERARERGENLRAELLEQLKSEPQTAARIMPQLSTRDVSLSEVVFQLRQLREEGRVIDEDGVFRLA